jgi:drug/metabolite transporter (DMT)-like permease
MNPLRHIKRWEGVLVLLTTLACWSSVPLFIRHLAAYVDHWSNNGWRYGASALFWLPAVVWAVAKRKVTPSIWRAALIPATANTLAQIAFTAAHEHVNPGLLTFAMRLQLVAVAAGAYLLFPAERPTIASPRYLGGIALLVCGIAGVLLGGGDILHDGSAHGVLLALGAGMGYGAYGLAVRKFMVGFHPIYAFGVIALYTGGALVLLMLGFGKDHGACVLELAPRELWELGISAFVGIALGHVLYYTAIDRLGVATTAGVLQLQPFVVSAASAVIFGEVLSRGQWLAGIVAVAGAALVLSAQKAAERKRAAAAREMSAR